MKIIDHTPFYNHETGEISLLDRAKALMNYGAGWIAEIEAQKLVIAVLDPLLDKSYTLLRNVTPPGLDASIPLILIGQTGIYVMYVTPLTGMYRAKGDQWGTVSGNNFKPEKPNLLVRTERMARAVQLYLQRQGYLDLINVEPALLCSDPGFVVDSLRPIVRVVMRDALERFAVSVTQARVTLSPEAVHDIANRILNPPRPAEEEKPPAPEPAAAAAPQPPEPAAETPISTFNLPETQPVAPVAQAWTPDRMGFDFQGDTTAQAAAEPAPDNLFAELQAQTESAPAGPFPLEAPPAAAPAVRRKRGLTRGQLVLLVLFAIIECILLMVFGYIVYSYSL